ncbi:MAG: pantoate--beta-alanine ligase [Candidatus Sumerlaeota bacterium]|nr:pantoate--beta-alanine ligase [Candidatus Sumerlaeota bacterium]
MEVIETIAQMRELRRAMRLTPETTLALVPTMGALHKGHGRLIQRALTLATNVVVSSFVNPLQFNDSRDLASYPRTPEQDQDICKKLGVHYYFMPKPEEIYPPGFLTTVNVSHLSKKLEGASRPGHFRGVCTVVTKLFNIVQPDFAVFGHKDAQQLVLIRHMVRDLAMDVEIVAVPTERDKNGLALSSRNVLLDDDGRRKALCLNRALRRVHFLVKKQGITHVGELLQAVRSAINSAGDGVELDYAHIVSRMTLEELNHVERGNTLVLIAARVGGVRLIDSTRL